MLRRSACLTGLVLLVNSFVLAGDWPAFRGPSGTGISHEKNLPSTWGPGENILWKTPIPGLGHSSPILFPTEIQF